MQVGKELPDLHRDFKKQLMSIHPDPACKLSANLYTVYLCCVYREKLPMMDRGTVRNM
jgi:hypothetical protein